MSGYTPNKWVDREGTTRYFETIDADGAKIFTPDYTQVTEMGTPVNEDNMNHIEEGIAAGSFSKYDSMTTYEKDDLVTAIIDNELKVYKSLQDNNNGNTLTDTTFWEEVEFAGGGAGLQLFDLIEKDHILTFEESKGLALLGTYIYKEAVAGSRYGYPDFYNRVIDEYNNATEEAIISRSWVQPTLTENGTLGGNTFAVSSNVEQYSDNAVYHLLDGVTSTTFHSVSGTKIGYIDFYNPTALRITNLQITNQSEANRASTAGVIYGSNDGLDWKQITTYTNAITASSGVWNIDLSNNESYYKYYRLESTAGGTTNYWTIAEIAITATEQLATVKRNSNGHCFYDIANKVDIDNVYDIYGFAWYYGVDTTNERIFLPRGQNYLAQGNNNAISVDIFGNGNALGITTDLTKDGYAYHNTASGSGLYPKTYTNSTTPPVVGASAGSGDQTGTSKFAGITTDPTKSGLVGTVDLSDIGHKAYIYMCVGNTEVSEAVTGVTEVTTTENDTLPLFAPMYFDYTPNNVSWLRAGEQKKSSGIYKTAYNELVNELTTPKYGLKVIETADMQDGVDYSEYWKVNQDEMYFTTPTAISNKALSGAVVGNGMALGITDGTNNAGLKYKVEDNAGLIARQDTYGENIGYSGTSTNALNNVAIGVTSDPTKSGIIAEQSTAQLYFKVANAVQNLELLDAGEVLEAVNNVVPNNSSLISSYAFPSNKHIELTLGATGTTYKAPANGWFQLQMDYVADKYVDLWNSTAGLGSIMSSASSGRSLRASVPCKKGDVVTAYYTATNVSSFKFIYAQGEVQ